jgi:hypothetical protein
MTQCRTGRVGTMPVEIPKISSLAHATGKRHTFSYCTDNPDLKGLMLVLQFVYVNKFFK